MTDRMSPVPRSGTRREGLPASDVPRPGETTRSGIERGERQSRDLRARLARAATVGPIVGAAIGMAGGIVLAALGEPIVEGPAPLTALGVTASMAVTGVVLGVVVALARADGAEQRELDEQISSGDQRLGSGAER